MRITHFCDSHAARPDGVSRSVALTVALLRDAGHEVLLVRPGPLTTARPAAGHVRSIAVPSRQVRVGLLSSRTPVRPPDVVHVHTTGPIGMTGFRLAARWRVPLVVTWHTDLLAYADVFPEIPIGAAWCALRLRLGWSPAAFAELTRPGAIRRRRLVMLGRAMFARTAAAVAPSAKTAAGLVEFAPLPEVSVLPTPAPPLRPRAPGNGGDLVLSVGRATAEKNPELLLRAFARVRAAKPAARLIMVGVRQDAHRVRHRIRALGLSGHVDVLPPVPPATVAEFYRAADVLALPSLTDTQSLVLTEAEAAGLPAVLADARLADARLADAGPAGCGTPGSAWAGSGPAGGFRFATEPTPEAFAAGLLRMLDDAHLRDEVTRAGLAATAAYPPELFLTRLTDLYGRHAHPG